MTAPASGYIRPDEIAWLTSQGRCECGHLEAIHQDVYATYNDCPLCTACQPVIPAKNDAAR